MPVMTDQEQEDFIRKGGEFGAIVAGLTSRAIDAETLAETLTITNQLQERQIAELQKRLSNTEAQRDDAYRDLGVKNAAISKVEAIMREVRAQQVAKQQEQELTGKPARDLRVVRETAIENARQEAGG